LSSNEENSASLKPIYIRQILFNFSSGIINPYVSIYAVQLGASSEEMGWLRSLTNLFGNILQVPWGIVSDKMGRYLPAILIGGLLSALLWLPLLIVAEPIQLISIIALQALATSIVAPAWASLIGKMMIKSRRGVLTSYINITASIGSIGATLLSGYIMTIIGGSLSNMYMIPIILATLFGILSSIVMVKVREEKKISKSQTSSSLIDWTELKRNVNFQTLCKVSFVHSFFMSMSWPLFAITKVQIIGADMMQFAFISVISGLIGIIVRRFIGRITDYAGRKTLLVISRAGIFIYPTLYALATNINYLFLAELIVGVFGAISGIVLFAYQLDITPKNQRGAGIALYNTVIGVATFLGSLSGGYIPSLLSLAGVNSLLPLQITYAISAIGRFVGGILFLRIKEPVSYPSTVKRELTRIISEDIERTRDQIKEIDLRGEMADQEFEKDNEWLEEMKEKKGGK
jgi:MFS family permease